MEDSEQRKVNELIKEMRTEADSKDVSGEGGGMRLNWMYKGPSDLIDREEYLLGRAIDKSFEALNGANSDGTLGKTEQSNIPKRLLEKTDSTEQVDIAKKILEDPLYAIKQKEMEVRKKLLNNPVKLKQIKQMLYERSKITKKQKKKKKEKLTPPELNFLILKLLKKLSDKQKRKALNQIMQSDSDSSSESSSSEKERYHKKNSYKNLKRKKSSSSSEDSESSSNSEESEKSVNKAKKQKKEKRRRKKKDLDSDSSSDDRRSRSKKELESKSRHGHSKKSKSSSSSSTSSSECDSTSSSEEEKKRRKFQEGKSFKKSTDFKSKNGRRNSSERRTRDRHSSERQTREKDNHKRTTQDPFEECRRSKKGYGLMMPDGSKLNAKKQSFPPKKYIKPVETKTKYVPPTKSKPLSEKEKAEKLKEMMEDAKLRKVDREKNLASHRKKESKEEDSKSYDEDFMRRQMSLLTSQGTMADRIKSNVNNIQRSNSSMDSNFMRK